MEREKIAKRISAIIAKAESTTNKDEAETFMAKVSDMLERYGMDLLEVGKLNEEDPIEADREEMGYFFASESPFRDVAFEYAVYCGCEAIVNRQGNRRRIFLAGRQSARITFQMMWPYIKKAMRRQASQLADGYYTKSRAQTDVANAMTIRLATLNLEKKKQRGEGGVNALVPVDLISQALKEMAPLATPASARKLGTTLEAMDAADGIGLDLQTTSRKPKSHQIEAQ